MFILFFILFSGTLFADTLSCSNGYTPYSNEIWTAGRDDAKNLQTDILTLSGERASIDIEKIWTYDTSRQEQAYEQFKIVFTDENGSIVYGETPYSKDIDNHQGMDQNTYTDLGMTLLPKGVKKAKLVHRADAQYGDNLNSYNSVTFKGICYKLNRLNEKTEETIELGDFVWLDLNHDGLQNDNETGVSDIKIELYHDQNKIAETVTDEYGHYAFKALKADYYHLKFIIKEGWEITKKDTNHNAHDLFDSDANTQGVVAVRGEKDTHAYDVGLYLKQRASLEVDINMSLNDVENAIVGDTILWRYRIKNRGNIKLSNIKLKDQVEGDLRCSKQSLFANEEMICIKEGIVENGIHNNQLVVSASLPSGKILRIEKASYYIGRESLDYLGSIGDRVWLDDNNNGIQDSGESGISGIEVLLYDENRHKVTSMQTNENGNYFFEKIKPSLYYLMILIPKGYAVTQQHQGHDNKIDSDAKSDGTTSLFRVGILENIADKDFGLYRK